MGDGCQRRTTACKNMKNLKYTVIIQWSDEDQTYVVSLPEWGTGCKTHGATYEQAARNAGEVLKMLLDTHDSKLHGPPPSPALFCYPGQEVVDLAEDRGEERHQERKVSVG